MRLPSRECFVSPAANSTNMATLPRPLVPGFVVSSAAHRADNEAGRNHWSAYVPEVCDQLGLKAIPLEPESITPARLSAFSTLFLPEPADEWLGGAARDSLRAWVSEGGLLIGMGTTGLDDLFGVSATGACFEQPDDFSPAASLLYGQHSLTGGAVWPLHPEAPAPILAPVRLCEAGEAETLAQLHQLSGKSTVHPAITYRQLGQGACLYFTFDLAKHMWVAHQGRPVDADHDGDGYLRLSDAIPARDFEPELPYADQLLFLLRDAIARTGQPFVSPLPPMPGSGKPADLLLFWGGDDEAAAGTQIVASNFMREMGLPYHLNLMPDKQGGFSVSKAEFDAIKANGHENSVHYDFQTDFPHPYAFTEAEVLQQAEWYEQAFGERAQCSVFHWCHWTGWSEPAEWMLKAGGCADNSRIHRGSPPLNPTNLVGYVFGTSFPYRFFRDHRGGNERLPFLSEPITLYECGYRYEDLTTDFTQLHRGLEMAARFHLTTDLFFHPINVFRAECCREAVREALRWVDARGILARHMGNDELAAWWFARSRASLREVAVSSAITSFTVECDWPEGCVVQVPCRGDVARVQSSAGACETTLREEPWGRWLWIACPRGRASVEVTWR
jgi:hypothetical protein